MDAINWPTHIPPLPRCPRIAIVSGFRFPIQCRVPLGGNHARRLDDSSLEKTDWRKHWRVLRRRRWWVALPAFGVWLAVCAVAWLWPAVYRSETVILVEQQRVPEQLVASNVSADFQGWLQHTAQQILSRTRLLTIVEDFQLYPTLRTRDSGDELVERMRKDIEVELVQAPNRSGTVTAFKVAYMSNDPVLAQKVTSRLTSLFIDENLKARQQQSTETTQFLATQLKDAGRALAEQEEGKDIQEPVPGQLPEQVQSNLLNLAGLQAQLQQETDMLGRAQQQSVYLDTLRTQWRSLEPTVEPGNTAGQPLLLHSNGNWVDCGANWPTFSSHYTERHPDVRKIKDQIAKTEKLKQQAESRIASSPASGASETSLPEQPCGNGSGKPAQSQ